MEDHSILTRLPRVLHVIEPAEAGGAESVVRLLAVGAPVGAHVGIAAIRQGTGGGAFVDLLRDADVSVTEICCGRRRYVSEVLELERIAGLTQADVLHTHVYHGDFVGYWAARRCGLPVVATVHGFTGGGWKNRFYQWLNLRMLRRFDAVICVSKTIGERVIAAGCPAAKTHVIPNGYGGAREHVLSRSAARAELGLGSDEVALGWVGRLSREKGPDLFVDAVAGLPPPRPVAYLIGDGPDRRQLQRRITRQGMTDDEIRLVGHCAGAARLLRAFDVLVMSSRTEGLPMVLLEAMAAGVPLVSFAVGGIPDVLDASSAWLVPPGDSSSLTSAIGQAIGSPEVAQQRARAARMILDKRFGIIRWLDRVYAVYREVCQQ